MQPQTGVPASLNTNYTWNGIIEFLQENAKNEQIKQTEWMLEKQRLNVAHIPSITQKLNIFYQNHRIDSARSKESLKRKSNSTKIL
mgnify:FL=1